jgi:hypothetical protein
LHQHRPAARRDFHQDVGAPATTRVISQTCSPASRRWAKADCGFEHSSRRSCAPWEPTAHHRLRRTRNFCGPTPTWQSSC